jgi:hypothetical protein
VLTLQPALVMRKERIRFGSCTLSVELQTQEACLAKHKVRIYGLDPTIPVIFLD